MPITVSCDCGKKYTVKDELVGKKIRCKECDAVIVVQKASVDDDDPFAGMTIKSRGRAIDEEDDEEEESDESPRSRSRRFARKEKPKPRRVSRSRDEMPMGVKFAIGAVVGLMSINFLGLLALMMVFATVMFENQPNRDLAYWIGLVLGFLLIFMSPVIIRIYIEFRVISGLRQRRSQTRLTATIMAVLMALGTGAFIYIGLSNPIPQGQRGPGADFVLPLISFQLLCELVVLIGLNLPSSSEFLSD